MNNFHRQFSFCARNVFLYSASLLEICVSAESQIRFTNLFLLRAQCTHLQTHVHKIVNLKKFSKKKKTFYRQDIVVAYTHSNRKKQNKKQRLLNVPRYDRSINARMLNSTIGHIMIIQIADAASFELLVLLRYMYCIRDWWDCGNTQWKCTSNIRMVLAHTRSHFVARTNWICQILRTEIPNNVPACVF